MRSRSARPTRQSKSRRQREMSDDNFSPVEFGRRICRALGLDPSNPGKVSPAGLGLRNGRAWFARG